MWSPDPSVIITAEQKASEARAAQRLIDFPNLEPDQFWFAVRLQGLEEPLREWIAGLDPLSYAMVSAKVDFAKFFERDHPFILEALEALGIPENEFDAMWQYAGNVK